MEAEGSKLTGAQTYRLQAGCLLEGEAEAIRSSACLHHLKSYLHTSVSVSFASLSKGGELGGLWCAEQPAAYD